MVKEVIDYNKYENYIRVGHTGTVTGKDEWGQKIYSCSDLADFPTPSSLGITLHDVDKDPFTDLLGYTHRNRVRHDVYDVEFSYNVLSENDLQYILKRLDPEWIYVELIDKKTKQPRVHKMYASDKNITVWRTWKDSNGEWHENFIDHSFSLVEE